MTETTISDWRTRLKWLLSAEVVILAGYAVLLACGQPMAAVAVLLLPLQLLLVVVLLERHLFLLGFFTVLLPFAGLELLPDLYREVVLFGVLLLICFLMITGFAAISDTYSPGRRWVQAALVVAAASVVLSGGYALARGWGTAAMLRYSLGALFGLLTTWVCYVAPQSSRHVRGLILIQAIVLVMLCVLLPVWSIAAYGIEGSKVVVTPFGTTTLNLFGFFVGPTAAALLGMSLTERRAGARAAYWLAVAILLAALVYTRSRGAWVGFGVAYLYIMVRRRSFPLLLATAFGAALFFSFGVFREAVAGRAEQTSVRDPAIAGRVLLWLTAIRMSVANWLVGIGAEVFTKMKFSRGFPRLLDPFERFNTHSFYLEVLVGLGASGFASYFSVPVGVVARLGRRMGGAVDGQLQGLALGLSAALIAFLAHGLVESPAWHAPTLAFWGWLLGLGLAVSRLSDSGMEGAANKRRGQTAAA